MNILIVCTGNTCRSPMAEGLLRAMLKQRWGEGSCQIISAGTAAVEGEPAAEHAITILGEIGIDLTEHRARSLNDVLIEGADLILAMTERHKDAVLAMDPEAAGKIHVLDMQDPFGMPLAVYRECAEQLQELLTALIEGIEKEEGWQGRKKNAGEE